MITDLRIPRPGLEGPFAGGTSWDELGRLAPSTASAWSVCLLPLSLERLAARPQELAC